MPIEKYGAVTTESAGTPAGWESRLRFTVYVGMAGPFVISSSCLSQTLTFRSPASRRRLRPGVDLSRQV